MPRRKKAKVGRPRKEVVIKLESPKPTRGRPAKELGEKHQTSLTICGTLAEISQLKVQAYGAGKSISRYIIDSLV